MAEYQYLRQVPGILDGLNHFQSHDPVFSRHGFNLDDFGWTYIGPGFRGLSKIVVGQQVSTAAAASIWAKIEGAIDPTPDNILRASEDDLRALGLSRSKVSYLKGMADAVMSGAFDPAAMETLSNADVTARITAMKGFGPWSAQMFLMFGLARTDVWAPGDLGIQYGLQYYLQAETRPDLAAATLLESRFTPHQTAASLMLWHLKIVTEAVRRAKQ